MATIRFSDAERLAGFGRPWTFRLEFHDLSINSHKFWLVTGRGKQEPVEVHFGRVGNPPTILVKGWDYIVAKTPEKEHKGYLYVDTPFIRVQQATIDGWSAVNGRPPVPTSVQVPIAPVIPTPILPVPIFVPVKGNNPFDRVVQVRPLGVDSWVALDAAGRQLFAMPKAGAFQLVQDNPHITVFGL